MWFNKKNRNRKIPKIENRNIPKIENSEISESFILLKFLVVYETQNGKMT